MLQLEQEMLKTDQQIIWCMDEKRLIFKTEQKHYIIFAW